MTDTGFNLRINMLSPAELERAMQLQDIVLAHLPQAERYFIVPKTAEQMAHYLTAEQVFSAQVNGDHAAQLIARHHVDGSEHERNIRATRDATNYILLQGALVNPAYRGRQLLQLLLTDIAATLPGARLMARIVPHNIGSLIGFFGAGFCVTAAAYDPDDERRVFYMENKPLRAFAETPELANDEIEIHPESFEEALAATAQNYAGVGYKRDTGMLVFRKKI